MGTEFIGTARVSAAMRRRPQAANENSGSCALYGHEGSPPGASQNTRINRRWMGRNPHSPTWHERRSGTRRSKPRQGLSGGARSVDKRERRRVRDSPFLPLARAISPSVSAGVTEPQRSTCPKAGGVRSSPAPGNAPRSRRTDAAGPRRQVPIGQDDHPRAHARQQRRAIACLPDTGRPEHGINDAARAARDQRHHSSLWIPGATASGPYGVLRQDLRGVSGSVRIVPSNAQIRKTSS